MNSSITQYIALAPVPWLWIGIFVGVLTVIAITGTIWLHVKPSNDLFDVRELLARICILVALMIPILNLLIGTVIKMVIS